ncbi:FAD-binding monooxygenase [Mucilaginibacter pallidiroseus]|uniref:FAD-binding monooxygenase n=1 Tax=Mucilaginibacter pallidiroseus TaxID=2599295 RepID=A0A563U3J8_9SPHI|nr:FAD-dependent monooxygenase [Mucilaginibacter pallidiroseus]TWR25905.1 FAD-binding monooxygenase [Mucilaginibacter pallidiroseus]
MKPIKDQKILVSGASIAGLSTAWWLSNIGYQVTIVEMAAEPRTAGGAVDLTAQAVDIIKRMGLYQQFKGHQLGVDRIDFKNADNITEGSMILNNREDVPTNTTDEIEIERDKFVQVMLGALGDCVEFIFNDSVHSLHEENEGLIVSFKRSTPRTFDLVIGCDGSHSNIRKLWFGPESDYNIFLGAYFSISIVPGLLVPQRTMQMYRTPDQSVMLNAYNGKTDIIFTYLSEQEMAYDYRDTVQQRQLIANQFRGKGWRTDELLDIVDRSGNFYFDKFCQIKMPCWSKSRVALVGDAAYCASPAAGQGGSLSVLGAAALAEALQQHGGAYQKAFTDYEAEFRPHIEEVQAMAESNVKENFMLKTDDEIRQRNREAKLF